MLTRGGRGVLVGRACFFLKRGETVAIFFCLKVVTFSLFFLNGGSFTVFSYSECFIYFPPGNWDVYFFKGDVFASNAPPTQLKMCWYVV